MLGHRPGEGLSTIIKLMLSNACASKTAHAQLASSKADAASKSVVINAQKAGPGLPLHAPGIGMADRIIDLTGKSSKARLHKCKRSLVPKGERVNLGVKDHHEDVHMKCHYHCLTVVKLEGKGTEQEPYLL